MILVLAGTTEARALCRRIADLEVTASLAGVTEAPKTLGVPTRIGGFVGGDGFLEFCKNNGVEAVVDATHPFAAPITERTYRLCTQARIPYLRLERPAWTVKPSWHRVRDAASAAATIPNGARVFLATGRQTLQEFEALGKAEVFVRVVEDTGAEFPFERGRFVFGLPSKSVEEEKALLSMLGVDYLVTKNSGGSDAKLRAAEELGLSIIVIERPEMAARPLVATVEEAEAWVRARCR